jgi:hypothetical protein
MRPPNLVDAIRAVLTAQNQADDRTPGIHVSDLAVGIPVADGGKCKRQLWLQLQGAEKRQAHAGEMLMWAAGHRLQEAATQWLEEGLGGWRIHMVERPVRLGNIVGRYDALLLGPDGERVVVDFKTARGRSFDYLDGPKPAHEMQVRAYCMAVEADYGMLLYMDREGQNFARQFVVERDDEKVRAAVSEAERIAGLAEPPPVLDPVKKRNGKLARPWNCDYCPFLDISCDGADVTGIDAAFAKLTGSG